MRIKKVLYAGGRTGFFFDDQKAIKAGAAADGEAYLGKACTQGFSAVRQAGECVSVLLLLEDGQLAWGDCAAVQYSGAGGRDPLFLARDFIPVMEAYVTPALEGAELTTFRGMAEKIEGIVTAEGARLHTAVRYGVTQALLDAVAKSTHRLMCRVIADEYGCTMSRRPIPIFAQSGDNRYANADKMILKGAQVLPHALINNVDAKLGRHGELLLEYVGWLRERILKLRPEESYAPVLHIDVYGTIGQAFGNDNYEAMAEYLGRLCEAAKPFRLRIEGPMDAGGRQEQMEALRDLRRAVDERCIPVELVADEWCNTLEDIVYFADNRAGHMIQIKTPDLGGVNNVAEAVLYCKQKGIGAYQGGTCNETERSAQVCVHIAMAAQPDQILAKPGMGVDEGYMIVYNEMRRILTLNEYLEGGRQ
ncbi:MAG TPA: methylaspartate ammonia-lyase [Feifaniaceae bacterium]|nr:methylaspartate ammonia-lyase [Feifaniaceae bacterium]